MSEESPLFRKKALEKLRSPEQLNQLLIVTSPKSWLVLLAVSALLLAVLLWSVGGIIQVSVPGRGALVATEQSADPLQAVIYVALDDGQRIHPGMPVRLSPAIAPSREYGFLQGEVLEVNPLPADRAQMLSVLKNDALVQSLAAAGQLLEVRVGLTPDANTTSGYAWTLAQGPPASLEGGTLANGEIVVSQEHPIELVFPIFQLPNNR